MGGLATGARSGGDCHQGYDRFSRFHAGLQIGFRGAGLKSEVADHFPDVDSASASYCQDEVTGALPEEVQRRHDVAPLGVRGKAVEGGAIQSGKGFLNQGFCPGSLVGAGAFHQENGSWRSFADDIRELGQYSSAQVGILRYRQRFFPLLVSLTERPTNCFEDIRQGGSAGSL